MADYIGISKPLIVAGVTPKPEINYFYGPWESVEEALDNIPQLARIKGLTVGIIEDSEIVEYWFKNGVELVLKTVYPTYRSLVGTQSGSNARFQYIGTLIQETAELYIGGLLYPVNIGFTFERDNTIVITGAPIPTAEDIMRLKAIYLT